MFDGARADLTKNLSYNPLFQLTHSFVLGSSVQPASYSLGVNYASENVCISVPFLRNSARSSLQVFLQGTMDHEGSVSARFNHGWTANNVFKAQAQVRTAQESLSIPFIDQFAPVVPTSWPQHDSTRARLQRV